MDYRLKKIFPQFVADYLTTAAWVTCDADENSDFTNVAAKEAELHCAMFFGAVVSQFGIEKAIKILSIPGNDLGYISAHDFWLTRNGHGAGFWDKEDVYGVEDAQVLTKISEAMGEVDCYHLRGPRSKLTF